MPEFTQELLCQIEQDHQRLNDLVGWQKAQNGSLLRMESKLHSLAETTSTSLAALNTELLKNRLQSRNQTIMIITAIALACIVGIIDIAIRAGITAYIG